MNPRLNVSNRWQTAIKPIVLCCGCLVLGFAALVWLGYLPKIQGVTNTFPARQVFGAPPRFQPKLVAS